MTPPADAWAELARTFRHESARSPDLCHALIKLPEWRTQETRWDRPNPAIVSTIQGDPIVQQWIGSAAWPEPGYEQVFYGGQGRPLDPAWRQFVELARTGVELATDTGVITSTSIPGPGWMEAEWVGTWMYLVFRVARELGGPLSFRVREWQNWDGLPLPDGMLITALPMGIYLGSAYAAEQLSTEAVESGVKAPLEPIPNASISRKRAKSSSGPNPIPIEHRTRPMCIGEAGALLFEESGKNRIAAGKRLRALLDGGNFSGFMLNRQTYVFDVRSFPESARSRIKPGPSRPN